MPSNYPRLVNLNDLARITVIDRGALERMIARDVIFPDAELRRGVRYVPLFLEARAPEIMLKRSQVLFSFGQIPRIQDPELKQLKTDGPIMVSPRKYNAQA